MKYPGKTKPFFYGFTMVELLIVVVVLALLTLVSGTMYTATMKTARDGKRKVDLENIRSALEVYRSDNSTYPDVTFPTSLASVLNLTKQYITMPTDPKNHLNYYYNSADCQTINSVNICNSYVLAVRLENPPASVPVACSGLTDDSTGKDACFDTAGASAQCSYCLDPYGLLPVSATTSEGDGVGEIQLPANE
jgi:general secretion pathway protein G